MPRRNRSNPKVVLANPAVDALESSSLVDCAIHAGKSLRKFTLISSLAVFILPVKVITCVMPSRYVLVLPVMSVGMIFSTFMVNPFCDCIVKFDGLLRNASSFCRPPKFTATLNAMMPVSRSGSQLVISPFWSRLSRKRPALFFHTGTSLYSSVVWAWLKR